MLRTVSSIRGYVLRARDGEIGRCEDFLFDDEHWTVRYMVADTGNWLVGRRVLISPISLGEPDWASRMLPVRLTKNEIEEAPAVGEDAPVSRQFEMRYHAHYGWPHYWGAGGVWGMNPYPMPLYDETAVEAQKEEPPESGDSHLRSVNEVRDYHIQASDGDIGHVEDFILDDASWTLRYMVVDTRNWLPGRKVLIAPPWIDSIDWVNRKVDVSMTRENVKNAPEYDPSAPVNRRYEAVLYDYHGRPKYWE